MKMLELSFEIALLSSTFIVDTTVFTDDISSQNIFVKTGLNNRDRNFYYHS